ncbi:MAG: SAM-dependent methyltransferase [Rhodocyclaceae bacterium]|nr:MAG: SAM-dependent methyltransferase [Rhodocyclaceae bacterium]
MTPAEKLASVEGFAGEAERRKRLGQYFTGTSLGRVLAALADVGKSSAVMDPMCGNGDLLAACAELGADVSSMGAMDIDPIAIQACGQRLPDAARVLGSAFDPGVLGRLPRLQWDLVIANPPYVRYQSMSKGSGKDFPLPGAVEIRNGLISEIGMLPSLDDTDKELFLKLAQGYSGLADLAVPSWILCAGLVAPGGRLALVVPESWLSRDYATVVHYMLLRWFEIEFVVEDEHAAWFSDAQVKTTLLVAKRVPRRKGAFDFPEGKSFMRIAVSGKASGPSGPCSRLGHGKKEPERSFAKDARGWLSSGTGCEDDMVRAYHVPLSRVAANLRGSCSKQKWFAHMGETLEDSGPVVPHELEEWTARSPGAPRPVSLSSLGVSAGQGLRTGANSFFYAETAEDGTMVFDKLVPGAVCHAPADIALPAIRKQGDLPSGFVVEPETAPGRVLDLRRHALPEDIRFAGASAASAYDEIPEGLARIVRTAAHFPFGDEGEPKRIWELSAVAPNIRKGKPDEGTPPRFWYMLPDFARRHMPDLLMPRINTGSPRAWLNKDARCVIDANFATLWTDGPGPDKHALLALLNSAWTAATLEYSAAVMGGGALKVEAAHLRRLPVPPMDAEIISRLSAFGKRLARAKTAKTIDGLLEKIDRTVISAALGREAGDDDVKTLRGLAAEGKTKREKHKNKGKPE